MRRSGSTLPTRAVHARRREEAPCLHRIDAGMNQDVGAAPRLDDIEERQRSQPIHELAVSIAIELVQTGKRGAAPVESPGDVLHLAGIAEHIEKHPLVIAHEHARVRKTAHQPDDAHGIGAAVDHIAEHVDRILR